LPQQRLPLEAIQVIAAILPILMWEYAANGCCFNYSILEMLKPRILIVEDHEYNRLLLRRILELREFEIVEAVNGHQALQQMSTDPCDIILLDIMMPEIDGLTVCRELRVTHSASELPILMITAMTTDQDLIQGFAAGANDYITKPINPDILLARVNSQLQALNATRALIESQKQLASQKRMETVGLFAAGVAHNFNNLLGTVLGGVAILENTDLSGNSSQSASATAIKLISDAAKRGAELTKALLTFAKPSTRESCVNPEKIVAACIPLLESVAGHKIKFSLELPETLPELAISAVDLSHVLLELLQNSIESIEHSGLVHINALLNSAEDGFVEFSVRDSGHGIGHNVIDQVFEPFRTTKNIDRNIKIALDGSGLGLSTAYNIVTQSGGTIEISETSTAGTVVKFSIPVQNPKN